MGWVAHGPVADRGLHSYEIILVIAIAFILDNEIMREPVVFICPGLQMAVGRPIQEIL